MANSTMLEIILGLFFIVLLLYFGAKSNQKREVERALDTEAQELETNVKGKLDKKWKKYIYEVHKGKTTFILSSQSLEAVLGYIQDFRELKSTMTTEMFDRLRSSMFLLPKFNTINGIPLEPDKAIFADIDWYTSRNNISLKEVKEIHICKHGSVINIIPGERTDLSFMGPHIDCKPEYKFKISGEYLNKDGT